MVHKLKAKFLALSKAGKVAVVAGSVFLLGGIASAANPQSRSLETPATNNVAPIEQPQQQPLVAPKTEITTTTEVVDVPFEKTVVNDASLDSGTTKLRTAGVTGKKTLTYEITTVDGVETGKKLVGEVVTTQPVNEVMAHGTKVAAKPAPAPKPASCNANYSGCVPIASDVDCAGGSGNGPAYAQGPIRVIGVDAYDLDRDGDGIACE